MFSFRNRRCGSRNISAKSSASGKNFQNQFSWLPKLCGGLLNILNARRIQRLLLNIPFQQSEMRFPNFLAKGFPSRENLFYLFFSAPGIVRQKIGHQKCSAHSRLHLKCSHAGSGVVQSRFHAERDLRQRGEHFRIDSFDFRFSIFPRALTAFCCLAVRVSPSNPILTTICSITDFIGSLQYSFPLKYGSVSSGKWS